MRRIFKDKNTRDRCYIYRMLRTHARKKHVSFHTPGHKVGKWDITELSYSDNLSSPRGCIAEAERDIAKILGAKKSFLLTDGSTCGVFSMLYAAKTLGVKNLLVIEPVHKSVYNACLVLGLRVFPFEGGSKTHATCDARSLQNEAFAEGSQAILCTSPDYYGKVSDLAGLRALCDKTGKLLLIDGAHGGHLHFDKTLYAGAYADLWVDGVHKSLPALTQGAVVSARTESCAAALREGVEKFRTTSPSYPVMASVEYAVKYPRNEKLERAVRAYASENERVQVNEDYTKLCARFGGNAFEADKFLESKGVYSEFCDGKVVCFYLSPASSLHSLSYLKKCLKRAFEKYPDLPKKKSERIPAPLVLDENVQTEWVEPCEAIGKLCGGSCGLFPPCTPLIRAGERITAEHIALLRNANHTFGLRDGKILVWKNKGRE